MKKEIRLIAIVASVIVLCAWTTKNKMDIRKTEWLIGTWESKTSRGSVYESWGKANDNLLLGKSYFTKGKDTIVFENTSLVQENGGLYYVPTVKNQNGGLPIRFTARTISETQMIFENQQHDFPQVIMYTRIAEDSLVAEISGTKDGKIRTQSYPMKRLK